MIIINKIYGILANGTPNASFCNRYSNVGRALLDDAHITYINTLLPSTASANIRAAGAELLLQLMMSGETWPEFVNKFDPNNTYDQRFDVPVTATEGFITMDAVKKWAVRSPFSSDAYPIERSQSAVEKTVNVLYAFMESIR